MSSEAHAKTLQALEPLIQLLSPGSVLTPKDEAYTHHSEPFAIQKQQNPAVVLVPGSVNELSEIIRFLYASDLDFAIRGHGFYWRHSARWHANKNRRRQAEGSWSILNCHDQAPHAAAAIWTASDAASRC